MPRSEKKLLIFLAKHKSMIFFWIGFVVVFIFINTVSNIAYNKFLKNNDASTDTSDISKTEATSNAEDCNVYGINLHGEIVTYHTRDSYNDLGKLMLDETSADDVNWVMKNAQSKDNIKAVVVEIDSYGGSGEAGEEMMGAFKDSTKPVVAFIRNAGLSAAYLAATGAQTIFASKFSDVGGIGVTGSYLQETEKNKKEGLTYVDLSSGKYKDSGNPNRALSDDEKQVLMRNIKIAYEYFVNFVAQNRNLDVEKVKKLADGSSVMGEQALENGLIDKIGSLPEVESFLMNKIGETAKICWEN